MTAILKYPRIEATKEEAEGITVSELLEMKALFDRLTPVEKKDVLVEARKIALDRLAQVIAGK